MESYTTAAEYKQCFCKVLLIEKNEALKENKRKFGDILILCNKTLEDEQWRKEKATKFEKKIDSSTPQHSLTMNASNDWDAISITISL